MSRPWPQQALALTGTTPPEAHEISTQAESWVFLLNCNRTKSSPHSEAENISRLESLFALQREIVFAACCEYVNVAQAYYGIAEILCAVFTAAWL